MLVVEDFFILIGKTLKILIIIQATEGKHAGKMSKLF